MRNKAQIEGSISETYVHEECTTFCARYMKNVDSKLHRRERFVATIDASQSALSIFTSGAHRACGVLMTLSPMEYKQAEPYILKNCDQVLKYIE